MIRSFRDRETQAILEGGDADPKNAKRARKRLARRLWKRARAKLDQIDAATAPAQLDTPSNHLERLSGDRKGQYSLWIDQPKRVCFEWEDDDAWNVEIVDYHD